MLAHRSASRMYTQLLYASRLALLAALLGAAAVLPAGAQSRVVLQPESRMWIEGRSTMGAFTCAAEAVDGHGRIRHGVPARHVATDAAVKPEVAVVVPVESFDCGKRPMNQDLYEALQSDRHPEIRYELESVEVLAAPEEGGSTGPYRLAATGRLTLAGQTRHVRIELEGRSLDEGGRLQARGAKPVLMSDFGVKPPSALMGLIRADDRVVVRFDLVAAPEAVNATY